jgi:hypothetical protein
MAGALDVEIDEIVEWHGDGGAPWQGLKEQKENGTSDGAKQDTPFGLSDEGRDLMEKMAGGLGLSQTNVMEMAVRRLADQLGYRE